MEKIDTFQLKDGGTVDIVLPSMKGLKAITNLVNKLSKEDTFLSFAGEVYSIAHEKNWLKNLLQEMKFKKTLMVWAVLDGNIIGSCDVKKGLSRRSHVGTIGLMIDSDFRGQGLGQYLIKKVINDSKKIGLKIVMLTVFDNNKPAKNLYRKIGFQECGRLPDGLFRRGDYSDDIWMYKNL